MDIYLSFPTTLARKEPWIKSHCQFFNGQQKQLLGYGFAVFSQPLAVRMSRRAYKMYVVTQSLVSASTFADPPNVNKCSSLLCPIRHKYHSWSGDRPKRSKGKGPNGKGCFVAKRRSS